MRLLITRPGEDRQPLMARLQARGHQVIAAPVMEIVPCPDAALDLSGVQAVLATSRNGIRAFAARTTRRDLPLFAVGTATAATARAAGFRQVETAGGDVAALIELARARLDPASGALVHVAGRVVAGDLAGALAALGFTVRRVVLYEARAVAALAPAAVRAIAAGRVDGVLFYSPRTAKLFGERAQAAGLASALTGLTAFCLAPAVAEAARPFRFGAVRVAVAPREEALLALIEA